MKGQYLLDANVLIALTVTDHEHHERASSWFTGIDDFAVCPITQGALVRFLLRLGESGATCRTLLVNLREVPGYHFWPDDLCYSEVDLVRLQGYRQVTDAYLTALAVHHGALLATFDVALAKEHERSIELVG